MKRRGTIRLSFEALNELLLGDAPAVIRNVHVDPRREIVTFTLSGPGCPVTGEGSEFEEISPSLSYVANTKSRLAAICNSLKERARKDFDA